MVSAAFLLTPVNFQRAYLLARLWNSFGLTSPDLLGFLLYTVYELVVLQLPLYLLRLWDSKLTQSARGSICLCCRLFAALELLHFSCNFCFLFIPLFFGSAFIADPKATIFPSQSRLCVEAAAGNLFGHCTGTPLTAHRIPFLHQVTHHMACSNYFTCSPLSVRGVWQETVSCPTGHQDCKKFCPILCSNDLHKPVGKAASKVR